MANDERRRADRHPVDLPGALFLSESRQVSVRIQNLGPLGALVRIADLEEPVREGERALLDHPKVGEDGTPGAERVRTPCAVVRVELDFRSEGVHRELAVFFDGGPAPEGHGA